MLRMLGPTQHREVKATQNLSIIVLFFMICWIPLYTINCVIAFCSQCEINETFMLMCIILSHANSAGNPLLYAYHLKDFREAMKNFLCGLIAKNETPLGTQRTSLVSHANNYGNYKHYSLRESRMLRYTNERSRMESPIYYRRTAKSMSLPGTPKLANMVPSSIDVASAVAETNDRQIWRISEGAVVEDSSNSQIDSSNSRNDSSPYQKVKSSSSSEPRNGSYLNDVNYEVDDDVFLDDAIQTTDIDICPSVISDNKNDVVNKKNDYQDYLSASPQINQSVFLVESELMELDRRDMKTVKIYNVKESSKPNGNKWRFKLSLSSSNSNTSSPLKASSLSPLKVVSDFLWSTTNRQGKSVSEDVTFSSKNNDVVRIEDIQKNHSVD